MWWGDNRLWQRRGNCLPNIAGVSRLDRRGTSLVRMPHALAQQQANNRDHAQQCRACAQCRSASMALFFTLHRSTISVRVSILLGYASLQPINRAINRL